MAASYIPKRNDLCLLDFEPTKGKEIGKYRPALILSNTIFHKTTGLLICCPISSQIRGGLAEIIIDHPKLDKNSIIIPSLIQTLDWKHRQIKYIGKVDNDILDEVLNILIPLIGGEHLLL